MDLLKLTSPPGAVSLILEIHSMNEPSVSSSQTEIVLPSASSFGGFVQIRTASSVRAGDLLVCQPEEKGLTSEESFGAVNPMVTERDHAEEC